MACAGKELAPSSTFDLIPSVVAGRTMVLLQKMPDGCIQALENYRSAKSSAKHLSVLWNGNKGEIKIVTGEEEKDRQLFAFSTIAETTGKASAAETSKNVEDILRTSSQKRQLLQAVGTVTCKVKVKARDTEVFQRTRNSVRSAEEKWRGVRTREMDMMDARGTKGAPKNAKNNGTRRPTPTVSTGPASSSLARTSLAHASTGMKKSAHSSPDSAAMAPPKVDLKSLKGMLTYILAPKPLKKSDIMSRLAKAEKSRKSTDQRSESRILSALDSVANQSHDQYHLKPAFLTGLQVSLWSHYTDTEKQVLHRKLKIHAGDSLGASSSVNGASLTASSRTSTPSPSEQLRSPFRSVAGLVDELGLTNEKSPSSQLTPLAQGHIRTARQQQQQQQQQQSHHQQSTTAASSSSINSGMDDPAMWTPVTMEKLKHNSTPALRRATLSKTQANMLTATSKARHATSSANKTRLKAATASSLAAAPSPSPASSSSAGNSSGSSSATAASSQSDTSHHAASHSGHRASQHSSTLALRSSNRSAASGFTVPESSGNSSAGTASATSSSATSSTTTAATTAPPTATTSRAATHPMSTTTVVSKGKGLKRHHDPRPSKQEPGKKRRSGGTAAASSTLSSVAPPVSAASASAAGGASGSAAAGGGAAAATISHRKSTSAEPQINVDEDWKSKYLDVTSYAIRCSYKNDFNSAYPVYCQLKSKMDKVMGEFQSLEEQWKEAEGTPEEDRVYERVISLHEKYMKDSTFKFDRQKLQFLHNKLSHIKLLIGVYDSQLLAQ